MWGGHIGSTLLARLFLTLSVIVECCGIHPSTEVLAKDLFDLVWGFRDAEISEVRGSVLCAVGTSLASLRDDTLLALLHDSSVGGSSAEGGGNLVEHLHAVAANDPDDNCRRLAGDIFGAVSNSVRAIEM